MKVSFLFLMVTLLKHESKHVCDILTYSPVVLIIWYIAHMRTLQ